MNLIPDRREFFLCADHVRIRIGTLLGMCLSPLKPAA